MRDINTNQTPQELQDSSDSDDDSVVNGRNSKYLNTKSSFHQTAGFNHFDKTYKATLMKYDIENEQDKSETPASSDYQRPNFQEYLK